MSYRIRTPKRDDSTTYNRTVAGARQNPVVRPRARRTWRLPLPRSWTRRLEPSWRWVSGLTSLFLTVLLTIVLTADAFRVSQIEVGGLRTVPAEEIFSQSGVAGLRVVSVAPQAVAEAVADSPSIATANVRVYWPARVIVQVHEREPALVWEQEGARYWVDVRGNLMTQREDLPNLIRILSESPAVPVGCPGSDCPGDISGRVSIEQDIVEGALQLKTLRADVDLLYYDRISGLSFRDVRGWRAYFGVGTDMHRKLMIYEAIISDLEARGLAPEYVNVSNPDAPFYRLPGSSG